MHPVHQARDPPARQVHQAQDHQARQAQDRPVHPVHQAQDHQARRVRQAQDRPVEVQVDRQRSARVRVPQDWVHNWHKSELASMAQH